MRKRTVSRKQRRALAKGRALRAAQVKARGPRERKMVVDVLVMLQVLVPVKYLKEKPGGNTPLNTAIERALDSGTLQRVFNRKRMGVIEHAFVIGEESGTRGKAP